MAKIIRVDQQIDEQSDDITQWAYDNECSSVEYVEYVSAHSHVSIHDSVEGLVSIYVSDIPNLIKALQAAHKHITNS